MSDEEPAHEGASRPRRWLDAVSRSLFDSPRAHYTANTQVPSWSRPRLTNRRRLMAATRSDSPN